MDQIAKMTDIQFASAQLVKVAAKCLAGLMEVYADEAASTKAKIDNAVDKRMQGLAKSKSAADAESKTTMSGAVSTANPEGTPELSTHKVDEDNPPQATSAVDAQHQVLLLGNVPQHRKPPNKPMVLQL